MLEHIIEDPETNVRKYLNFPESQEISLDKAFIALVAPSFAGKTQSAFVMRNVRPLYFALDLLNPIIDSRQSVYKNFTSLSLHLSKASENDYESIKREIFVSKDFDAQNAILNYEDAEKEKNESICKHFAPLIFQKISAENLLNSYGDTTFECLGFLMKLIEDAEENYHSNNENWMRFYINRESFYYSGKTPKEFKLFISKLPNKYCLFLDEFSGKTGSVLIRNLARGTTLKCIVANTNSDIANLTGQAQSCASRTNPTDVAANRDVWSVVFNCLNNADWDLSFGRVEESINKLIEYCQNYPLIFSITIFDSPSSNQLLSISAQRARYIANYGIQLQWTIL